MPHTLPPLPYAKDALAPHLSEETLTIHHGKHHNAYVTKLNALLEGHPLLEATAEEVIDNISEVPEAKRKGVFNSAGQHINHTIYWNSMKPGGGGQPTGALADKINQAFGSFDNFKKAFSDAAANHFASGWAWLVQDANGQLKIFETHDGDTPRAHGLTPLLTCDVWEHAYYIDYRNLRPNYIEAFWNVVNWDYVASQLQG